ncbi:TetR/AcrR family transcriptional regulator [Streptomyces sp. AS02]|uniref:TetR/AcrR family transcriptional regulator n=1 Tax=Streptomyces sp. AS02 TaxID=2938946 RepID=UPI002021C5B3|nr:TetR/AcrR family transcriptional regulator [Streptomyces sp. AS02]MCL8016472.1 TetR/AcrR family transcriptional regulator [Streptomyces sp. AS02]
MTEPQKPRRRQSQRAKSTRQQIMSAAGLLFEEKGYEGAAINEIIELAGTTKGGFYFHFPGGRRELAVAILDSTLTMDGLNPQELKLQEVVDTGAILAYRITKEASLRAALRLSIHKNARDAYGTPWPNWVTINTTQLTEAQQNGELRAGVSPAEQAYQIAGAWAGLVLISEAVEGHLDNVEERVARMYMNLMSAIAHPGTLPEIDFSADRGSRLYTAHLEQKNTPPPDDMT